MDNAPTVTEPFAEESLFLLQLKVAQRADEIARSGGIEGGPWRYWSQAESEILVFEGGSISVGNQQATA